MTTAIDKAFYDEQGYIIIPNLIPPQTFEALEEACERVIAKTRSGSWPHRRTVGRQFPPFDDSNPDSWGVQHLMHPDLDEPAFTEWYTSDALINVATNLLQCNEDELQMELSNLLINPLEHDFALRWHRDDVRENATAEEEVVALALWTHGVQWNTRVLSNVDFALYEDSCLYLVPKTHSFPRTELQRAQSMTQAPPANPLDMPGAIQVTLQPGETVIYNNNILHCGAYNSKQRRATLHGCMGDIRGGSTRAKNVLQHGLLWMTEDRFRDRLNERGKRMLQALIDMKNGVQGDLGYSLVN
ncbi:uncharacterized protein HD556DRAFT_1441686 [Suillus plorans]|uniref:Phytanoyl-CoA dioxygenase n=1 Tax=Suillus plorans TaxID=116603 RepID=A0A9P7DIX2_9AGAM|nr:uncharacterized protein HD556DRAFT_1441686 [Suillus plorans]KAG1796384.1 hypothetical protein HD556DRAFT_1441686 [Suillus plorans]